MVLKTQIHAEYKTLSLRRFKAGGTWNGFKGHEVLYMELRLLWCLLQEEFASYQLTTKLWHIFFFKGFFTDHFGLHHDLYLGGARFGSRPRHHLFW